MDFLRTLGVFCDGIKVPAAQLHELEFERSQSRDT